MTSKHSTHKSVPFCIPLWWRCVAFSPPLPVQCFVSTFPWPKDNNKNRIFISRSIVDTLSMAVLPGHVSHTWTKLYGHTQHQSPRTQWQSIQPALPHHPYPPPWKVKDSTLVGRTQNLLLVYFDLTTLLHWNKIRFLSFLFLDVLNKRFPNGMCVYSVRVPHKPHGNLQTWIIKTRSDVSLWP